jgi:hypothetical protein
MLYPARIIRNVYLAVLVCQSGEVAGVGVGGMGSGICTGGDCTGGVV